MSLKESTNRGTQKPEDNTFFGAAEVYREYAEKKLGKRLRRVARKHNMPIPEQACQGHVQNKERTAMRQLRQVGRYYEG
jgi:hypothetical protein